MALSKDKLTFRERLSNISSFMKKATDSELQMYKFGAIGAIVVVMVGVWYFLRFKTLAIVLFLLSAGFLTWVLLEQSNRNLGEPNQPPKVTKKRPKDPPSTIIPVNNVFQGITMGNNGLGNLNFDSGLPNAKDYNKNLNKGVNSLIGR